MLAACGEAFYIPAPKEIDILKHAGSSFGHNSGPGRPLGTRLHV